jgi:hypothetical protein
MLTNSCCHSDRIAQNRRVQTTITVETGRGNESQWRPGAAMKEWFSIALRRDVVARGLKVGLIVGTILTAINHGDGILTGQIAPAAVWKIPLTYSTYAGVEAILRQQDERSDC